VTKRDRGFTLPELLISIVILGLIASVLVGVFVVVLRTPPSAEARADDARSLLGVTTWFPGDVNSTPRQPIASASPDWWNTASGTASGCTGSPGGTNLIRLRWTETDGSATTYEASYRLANINGWRIVRVSCVVGQAGTHLKLTTELPDPSTNPVTVTLVTDTTTNEVIGATMVITT